MEGGAQDGREEGPTDGGAHEGGEDTMADSPVACRQSNPLLQSG